MIAQGMTLDGVSAIALVVIASFAIDRVVNGLLFLLSFYKKWAQWFPEPKLIDDPAARFAAEKRQKLIYFVLAGFFGMIVLAGLGHVRILAAMGVYPEQASATWPAATASPAPSPAPGANPKPSQSLFAILDVVFTGLLLMGGADSIGRVLKMPGVAGVEKPSPRPIEITGKLTLEDRGPVDHSK
jgi:hypothetical protein